MRRQSRCTDEVPSIVDLNTGRLSATFACKRREIAYDAVNSA